MVKSLSEALEIDVRRVDVTKNFRPRLRRDVARRNHDTLKSLLARRVRNIDDKFSPDHRVIIGEGDARHSMAERQLNDLLGARLQALSFVEFGLTDAPVLAEPAAEIAPGGAEAQNFRSGQKMIQRLFLNRVDGEAGGSAVAKRIEFSADVLADVTEPGLAFAHAAKSRAEGAKNLAVILRLPPKRFFHMKKYPAFALKPQACNFRRL